MFLGNALRQKILAYAFSHLEESFYVRELAGFISEDPGNLSRELRRLEGEGILCSQVRGRLKLYTVNADSPLFEEVRSLVTKMFGVEVLLAQALRSIEGVERAFIFGSYAHNKMDVHSDIDLCVIGDQDMVSLHKAIAGVQLKVAREINLSSLSGQEYREKKDLDPFLKRIEQERKVELV